MKTIYSRLVLLILLVSIQVDVDAQGTTFNNFTGAWSNNSSWNGGWTDGSPAFTGLPETNGDITIFGQINVGTTSANQNLTFSANKDAYDLTINDTLIVYGDVDFGNKSMNLILGDGAVFIIFGSLDMNNRIDIASGGTLVVTENFNKNGSQGSFTGDGDVYAGSYSGDAETVVDSGGGDSSFTIDDLSDDGFEDIENFVDDVEAGGDDNPLPVELIYFNAENKGNSTLKWSTATEINNDHFVIERSEDGEYFYEIGKVKGNGNSNNVIEYSFEDKFILAPVEYYRLKQVDYNGDYEYFSAVRVETNVTNVKKQLSVYPTIVSNQKIIIKSNAPFELKQITIFDVAGSSNTNLINDLTKENMISYSVNLGSFKRGYYLIKTESTSGEVSTSRIFIK